MTNLALDTILHTAKLVISLLFIKIKRTFHVKISKFEEFTTYISSCPMLLPKTKCPSCSFDLLLINHKTNRNTHTEHPCPLVWIQQKPFSPLSPFSKINYSNKRVTHLFYSSVILSPLTCSNDPVLLQPGIKTNHYSNVNFSKMAGESTCYSSFSLLKEEAF